MALRSDGESAAFEGRVIINMTPHPLVFVDDDGAPIAEVGPSPVGVRLRETRGAGERIMVGDACVEVTDVNYNEVEPALPPPRDGTFYFVSLLTAHGLPGRRDVVFPLDVVRDESGRIVGCRSLGRLP